MKNFLKQMYKKDTYTYDHSRQIGRNTVRRVEVLLEKFYMRRLVKKGSILLKISHAGPGSVIPDLIRDRDDESGIRKRNYLKTRWIPGQARNDAKT
jgi:hypothetical protein